MSSPESILTLSALARQISSAVRHIFGQERFWVVAEVIGLKVSRGHCYVQLAEKDEINITPKAEFRGIIWASAFEKLHERFVQETGGPLREQLQILICVEVQFHERYGLSLIVHDLDPSYTLGQLELERRKTIERLKKEGIFELNRNRKLPDVIQKIAVISAEDSRGYEDFIKRLVENNFGYHFKVKLFPSLLQGDLAAADIIAKLIEIYEQLIVEEFDAVLIVRGGGGASSLGCFNDYNLSRAVARFPLPIITGIGHSANQSIVDEVANIAVITPTDAAVFLVNHNANFESGIISLWQEMEELITEQIDSEKLFLNDAEYLLSSNSKAALKNEQQLLDYTLLNFRTNVSSKINQELSELKFIIHKISSTGNYITDSQARELKLNQQGLLRLSKTTTNSEDELFKSIENKIRILDPLNVLKRGYSYTLKDDQLITDISALAKGDNIKTVFAKGELNSTITTIKNG